MPSSSRIGLSGLPDTPRPNTCSRNGPPAKGSFADYLPNATVSVLGKNGDDVRDAVVELKVPRMNGVN